MIVRLGLLMAMVSMASCGNKDKVAVQGDLSSLKNAGRSIQFDNTQHTSGLGLSGSSFTVAGKTVSGIRVSKTSDQYIAKVSFSPNATKTVTQDLKKSCLSFVEDNLGSLGVSPDQLTYIRGSQKNLKSNLVSVSFSREFQGLEVRDSMFQCVFSGTGDQWSLIQVDNSTMSDLPLLSSAIQTEEKEIDFTGYESLKERPVVGKRQVWFSKMTDDGIQIVKASEVKFGSDSELVTTVTVEQETGEILEAFDNLHNVTQLKTSVFKRSYYYKDDKVNSILPGTQISIGGEVTETDLNGRVDFGERDAGKVSLKSRRVTVGNGTYNNLISFDIKVAQDDGETIINPSNDGELRAYNAYANIHRVIKFARKHVTAEELPFLDDGVRMRINYQGNCNAYYVNKTITLYSAGAGCANMALVNDVNYHEWGHGYDDYTGIRKGISDGAFSEGIGDIISSYLTKSPNMGPGFRDNQEKGIRALNNTKSYPGSVVGQVHSDGEIIGGTFWSLRVALVERYGDIRGSHHAEKLFFRHALNTDSYRKSYDSVLLIDDDDNDPSTRSPNYCLINKAFAKHGLADDENCEDEVVDFEFGYDSSIAFTVAEEVSPDEVKIYSAAKDATEMLVCTKAARDCQKEDYKDVGLVLDGQKNGKNVFKSEETLKLNDLGSLSFMSVNDGTVIGISEFVSFTK